MQSMWLVEPGKFERRDIPRPTPGPDEVLLQIAYVGICPWDVRVYAGKKSVPLPRVMGHEAAGRIVEVGSDVKQLKPGQRVAADFIVKCGVCDACRAGRANRCQHPRFPNGAYERYAVLPQRNILPLRSEATAYRAAAFMEPLACVVRGQKMLQLAPGQWELVIGAGPIGAMHMQVAKRYGASVIVADLIDERLELARELGADVVVNSGRENLKDAVMAATGGAGVDAAVVAVGASPLVTQAAELLAAGGRLNIFAGIYPVDPLNIDPNLIHYKELVLTGSADSTQEDMREALRYIESREVQVEPLISHLLPLDCLDDGFQLVLNRVGMKVMVEVGGEAI
jgi:L-iditol 2-dehydrogenase